MARPANSELVTVAFLKTVTGVGANVATQLPEDTSGWAGTGFVVVAGEVGGGPELYVPRNEPVMQVDCYGVNPDSKFPAWDKATDLARLVVDGTYDMGLLYQNLTLRTGYRQAYVQTAAVLSGPRRRPGDEAAYAVMTLDLALSWIEVPE